MKRIKIIALLVLVMTAQIKATETKAGQDDVRELEKLVINYDLPYKERKNLKIKITYKDFQAATGKLIDIISEGKYMPNIQMYYRIMRLPSDVFQEKYRPLELLAKYNKKFVVGKDYKKEEIAEITDILYDFICCYNGRSAEYGKKVMELLEGILLKNIEHFNISKLCKMLDFDSISGATREKIAEHVINHIKSNIQKNFAVSDEDDPVLMAVNSKFLNKSQTDYLLNLIMSISKNKKVFNAFVENFDYHPKNCYVSYEFLVNLFDEVNATYQGDENKYSVEFIMNFFDIMLSDRAVITVNTHKLYQHAQRLVIENLDKIAPSDLSNILTAKYLDKEVGRKVAKVFMDKISKGEYKPNYLDLMNALHSCHINDKQRSVVIDMMIKEYEDYKANKRTEYDADLPTLEFLNLLRHKWHGYPNEHLHCNSDIGGLMHARFLSCIYYTDKQLNKILDFIQKNYGWKDVFWSYVRAQNFNTNFSSARLVDFFDTLLKNQEGDSVFRSWCVWYIAMHNASRDDKRIKAVTIIMQDGKTTNCIKDAMEKLKKPLVQQCEQGKCTEGKEPCCMDSVNKYLTNFKYNTKPGKKKKNDKRKKHKKIKYVKFDMPSKKPSDNNRSKPGATNITKDDLALYLENIDSVDLRTLCNIICYCDLDKKTRKMILEKIDLLSMYGLRNSIILMASEHIPGSYKKKLVKRMMAEREGSRALVAYKKTSLQDSLFMYKYCGGYSSRPCNYTGYFHENFDYSGLSDNKELYGSYADKYMDVLQYWIDHGDPEQSGENVYMSCFTLDYGRGAYCGCSDILCELTNILRRADLPEKQRDRMFKYICFYLARFLYFVHDVEHCSYYWDFERPASHASDRIRNTLCCKYTAEQYIELFKIIAKYIDKFDDRSIVSYLASDVIPQECKDILWNALREKNVKLPDEAMAFLRGCVVGIVL